MTSSSPSGINHTAEQSRIAQGQCPKCGIQTHEVKSAGCCKGGEQRFLPLTNEDVRRGRCLQCNSNNNNHSSQIKMTTTTTPGRGVSGSDSKTNITGMTTSPVDIVGHHNNGNDDFGDDFSDISHDNRTIAQRIRRQPRWLLLFEFLTSLATIIGVPVALYEILKQDESNVQVVFVEEGGGGGNSQSSNVNDRMMPSPIPSTAPILSIAPFSSSSLVVADPIDSTPLPSMNQPMTPQQSLVPTKQPSSSQSNSPTTNGKLMMPSTNQPSSTWQSSTPQTTTLPTPQVKVTPAPSTMQPQASSLSPTPNPTTPTPNAFVSPTLFNPVTDNDDILCISSIQFTGAIFKDDCNNCGPANVARYEDEMIVARDGEGIQFLSKMDADGASSFQTVTTFLHQDTSNDVHVSIFGNLAIAGIPAENPRTGDVYVYEKDASGLSWIQMIRLALPGDDDLIQGAEFGTTVEADDGLIAVGSPGSNNVDIYRRTPQSTSSWVHEAKLVPADGKSFGGSVSIKGDIVVVGDPSHGTGDDGAVFIYHKSSESSNDWIQMMESPLTNIDCGYRFGSSVTLTHDNGLMIGCQGESTDRWTVYYYESSDGKNYDLQQKITISDGVFIDQDSISVDGNVMVVSAGDQNNGKVYVYTKINGVWVESAMIGAPFSKSKYFGSGVALVGNEILISSRSNIYSYEIQEC